MIQRIRTTASSELIIPDDQVDDDPYLRGIEGYLTVKGLARTLLIWTNLMSGTNYVILGTIIF